ncbi:transmembrane and coiled-coil domain-containing protein 2 [Gracilinanus agilis]|uniref:transmembrane and coiled-coil domain-containing protein 2 n=1 Tax=Gracilinanus agilis TaxID=191870 RepID=UPI001CFCEA65|nr:transmembrane and coiled-coil domain-containing protein 2 [Gracilinanus agilis]
MGKTPSPPLEETTGFSLSPLWNWLQENIVNTNPNSWLSEYVAPTWQNILWTIFAICLILGTLTFWKRTFRSIKKVILFANILLMLYKKGSELFQDIVSSGGEINSRSAMNQENHNMLVTLNLQEKILKKLQMVEGKVKDLEDLIIAYKNKKNFTGPYCNCSDCQSPMPTSGFTSTSET